MFKKKKTFPELRICWCFGGLHLPWRVLSSEGSSRLWRLGWRSDCLRSTWSSPLSASVLLLSGTLTLKPALTTASSTTTTKVKTAHSITVEGWKMINSSLSSLPQRTLKRCIQRCWVLICSEAGGQTGLAEMGISLPVKGTIQGF